MGSTKNYIYRATKDTLNSILLPIFDDEKEKRYAERDSGRDEKDQGSGVASEGFFQR